MKGENKTRGQWLAEIGEPDGLPNCAPYSHMQHMFLELRPLRPDGHADWQEIAAFAETRYISAWERAALFEMCAAYASEIAKGKSDKSQFLIAPVDRKRPR